MLHRTGVGSSHSLDTTYIYYNIIPSTINTHNTELQMVKVHINNTNPSTFANMNLIAVASGTASVREISLDINKVTYSPIVDPMGNFVHLYHVTPDSAVTHSGEI